MTDPDIKKGLAGVVVDYTAVSKVNPETNSLLYRGYPVQELASTQPFEAVAYLLWYGELPTDVQLAQLRATERAYRQAKFDYFAEVAAQSGEELRRHFAERFFFGCEADDPMTAWAFDRHGNHRLNPIFSSDVGHFDVLDMSEVLEEAWELVEHGLINEDDFRQFVFANPARLHTAMNPSFFKGTVVEDAIAKV
jgi:hypothetical protein